MPTAAFLSSLHINVVLCSDPSIISINQFLVLTKHLNALHGKAARSCAFIYHDKSILMVCRQDVSLRRFKHLLARKEKKKEQRESVTKIDALVCLQTLDPWIYRSRSSCWKTTWCTTRNIFILHANLQDIINDYASLSYESMHACGSGNTLLSQRISCSGCKQTIK
jgi:hypothetical protein